MTDGTGTPTGVRTARADVERDNGPTALLAGHCRVDRFTSHPAPAQCPRCWGLLTPLRLSVTGSLYSYTVVHAGARARSGPYTVGYVDLVEGARVFAVITHADEADLRPDMGLNLRLEPDGDDYLASWIPSVSSAPAGGPGGRPDA